MKQTVFLFFLGCAASSQFTDVIHTESGPVRGVIRRTLFGKPYSSFKGIRYAEPPVGELRFKAPVKAKPWQEVYDAVASGNACPQFDFLYENYTGDEDCLFLNVYIPKTSEFDQGNSLPVVVYIYGGSFMQGYNRQRLYGPDYFLQDNVIVVVPNYRLGALGFLSTQTCEAPGNAGLKDQHLALVWVQENIGKFGGNAKNVMLFGQSAGGVSVDFHVLSSKSKGLFGKSSSMSATAFLPRVFHSPKRAVDAAFLIGGKLGFVTSDRDALVKHLREVDAKDLVEAVGKSATSILFKVTIEELPEECKAEGYVRECFVEQYLTGDYQKQPHLMGYTQFETLNFARSLSSILEMEETILTALSDSSATSAPLIQEELLLFRKAVTIASNGTSYKLINFTSDVAFVAEIDLKQRLLSETNEHPVYYYQLKYESAYSMHRFLGVNLTGATHNDDYGILFYASVSDLPDDPEHPHYNFCRKVVRLWTNFCKYSDPTPNGEEDRYLKFRWSDSGESGKQLEINEPFVPRDQREISPVASIFGKILMTIVKIDRSCYGIWERVLHLLENN